MEQPEASPAQRQRRRLTPVWLAAGAIAILVLGSLAFALAGSPSLPPQKGEPVPALQLTAFDGSPMDLSAHRGQPVVVNFFASWCDPCREEARDLEQTWRAYKAQGVQFFGIGYKDVASKAKAFLDQYGVTYPSTVEPGNRTARAYGVTGVPETFIIDRSGLLIRHVLGAMSEEELSRELDQLLKP